MEPDITGDKLKDGNGLGVASTVFFVVGDVVGAGIVTLPYTMRLVGWWGVPLFLASAILMCLCGVIISKSCIIAFSSVQNREELRDPYPQLADQSYGSFAKHGVTAILNTSLVFSCIIFLLLLGEIFTEIAPLPYEQISYRNQLRLWFLLSGIVLLPLTFLGTPKDFTGIGFFATACSVIAAILILLNIAMVSNTVGYTFPKRFSSSLETILAVFGTIQFTFGGVALFPTIQNDMKHPEKFPVAVVIGYFIVFVIYVAVSTTAFIVLDTKIQEDILSSFTHMALFKQCGYFRGYVTLAQVMICGHVLCAFVMLINPVSQQLEAIFDAPLHFTWQRIVIRSSIVVLVVTVASIVPSFGPVLSLAGGSLFSLLNIIFPILFYFKLDTVCIAKEIALSAVIILALVTAFGNGYIEVKNVIKVVKGTYQIT